MTSFTDSAVPPVAIPETDCVRQRLAVVLTEAALLRSQLRVSARNEREQARLRRLLTAHVTAEGGQR